MRKVVMLSAAAILGIASIAVSQAEEVVNSAEVPSSEAAVVQDTTAEAEAVEAGAPEVLVDDMQAAADTEDAAAVAAPAMVAAVVEEEPIPEDTPQVQKLIALYPNLIARIRPVGSVCFDGGDLCEVTVRAAGPAAGDGPREGSAVYSAVCQTCHAAGLLGSPILGDAGAWGPRIAQGAETLYSHAIQGYNAMPAKGGADIPDEEVQNAVDYMIAQAS